MKPVNLVSVTCAKHDFEEHFLELYLNNFGIKLKDIKEVDWDSLLAFFKKYKEVAFIQHFENFFWGYRINQIPKEFDLLRICEESVINIELKSENTGCEITNQLIKNKYYLKFLKRKIISFTYVTDEEKLYKLTDNDELVEADFEDLVLEIDGQEEMFVGNVNDLFDPSNYMVSPFNSTEKFLDDEYFLTDHQKATSTNIIKSFNNKTCRLFSIQGGAGTGKTLLTYDIAKKIEFEGHKVLIIHCGYLNEGHKKLRKSGWKIIPIYELEDYKLDEFALIILDEAQRIRKDQFDYLVKHIKKEDSKSKIIFSYDEIQCLSIHEIKRNIPKEIRYLVAEENSHKLTDKIRSNEELSVFIQNLFYRRTNKKYTYNNIEIQYFSKPSLARKYLKHLHHNTDWKVIDFTESDRVKYPYDEYLVRGKDNSHRVIGQEFDDVVAVIDQYFYFNQKGELSTKGWRHKPFYHPTKMLYQNVSRARNKLKIIIINNQEMLNHCLKTLNNN
ncbi:AAA family ATPase [Bacillus aerophilus]|nr:AAA family ATPase [Bacillus aerophilus]MBX7015030.1 AAA family ATPase [Bacillus aerophilus]